MVPRIQDGVDGHGGDDGSAVAEDDTQSITSTSEPIDDGLTNGTNMEPEYHTEDSDNSDDEEDESDSQHELSNTTTPLLPKALLKSLPSPAYSLQQPINIPREQMTRQQKVTQRNSSRKAKKRLWDRLRRDTNGTGVLEAGKAAQIKRALVPAMDKVKRGRVMKKKVVKPQASGRQQLLEQRKRAVEQSKSQLLRPQKKGRKRRRTRPSAG